jgi:hypothetical protein
MSDANLAVLAQISEQSWSVLPPSPKFRKSRFTKDTLNFAKETVVSGEIRDDRQIPDVLLVGYSSLGGYEFELSTQEFDLLLQNALYCTPTVVNLTLATVTCTASAKTVVATANAFANVLAGQRLMFFGTTNGALDGVVVFVSSISTDKATLTVDAVPDYTGPATVAAKTYRNGVVRNSMALEKQLTPTSFLLYQGCLNNTFKLTLEAKKIATGTCDFIGKGAKTSSTTASTGGTYNPQTTQPVLNCSNNVGQIKQGGAPVNTGIKLMSIEINNNLRPLGAIGQADLYGVGLGRCEVKGTMQIYFVDNTLLNMFIAHTKSSFGCVLSDGAGGALSIDIPSFQYDTGRTDVAGINTDVMLDTTYSAFRDTTLGYEIQICEFLAPPTTPTITSLTPNSATLGGLPTVPIIIAGGEFLPSSIVLVDGSPIPSTYKSAIEMDVVYTLPVLAGTVQFQVQDPSNGNTSAAKPFTVNAAIPTISALTPATAPHSTLGLGIVITGTNFISTDVVQIDGATVPSQFVSSTQMSLSWDVPGTAGTHPFTVKDPINNVTSAPSNFTVT